MPVRVPQRSWIRLRGTSDTPSELPLLEKHSSLQLHLAERTSVRMSQLQQEKRSLVAKIYQAKKKQQVSKHSHKINLQMDF